MPRIREGRGQADLRRGRAGTSPQHRTKSCNYLKPGTYTRRSCAERHVFTPGGPLRVLRGQAGLEQALDLSENVLDQAKMDVGNSV